MTKLSNQEIENIYSAIQNAQRLLALFLDGHLDRIAHKREVHRVLWGELKQARKTLKPDSLALGGFDENDSSYTKEMKQCLPPPFSCMSNNSEKNNG